VHNTPLWTSSDFAAPLPRGPGDSESLPGRVFDIEMERRQEHPVIAHVFGAVDLLTVPQLRQCVEENVDNGNGLVLDLSRVDFLAAAGLTVLADADRRVLRDNLAWALVANTRPVLRPLEVLGLRDTLPTYDTVPDAVAAVRAAVLTG
jgi:anti-sigma B factor antagonist